MLSLGYFALTISVEAFTPPDRSSSSVYRLSDGATTEFSVHGETLVLSTTLSADAIEPLFSTGAWCGSVVWDASLVLANFLIEEHVKNKIVLELGAGLALPSFTAAVLGAKRVVATEQRPLFELIARNCARFENMSALELDWERPVLEAFRRLDVVLISDCISACEYPGLHDALSKLILKLIDVHRASVVLMAVERRANDAGAALFFECWEGPAWRRVAVENSVEIFEVRVER